MTTLYTMQVTAEEMALLDRHREAGPHRGNCEETIEAVSTALRHPTVALLLERWGNGRITVHIDFENGRVKYVTPVVQGPELKAGRDL